jgi:hypothetical protein
MQHLTECLVPAGRVARGVTPAHRRSGGPWPACIPRHVHPCINEGAAECEAICRCVCTCDLPRWAELSVGRALELGAVPCKEKACAEVPS